MTPDYPKFLKPSLSHFRCEYDEEGLIMQEGLSTYTMCECCGEFTRKSDVPDTIYLVRPYYSIKGRRYARRSSKTYWCCHTCLAMWDDGYDPDDPSTHGR
jgi:hypothetical protein